MRAGAAAHIVRRFILTPVLSVWPSTNMTTTGPVGGAFSPGSFNYSLTASVGSLAYSISGLPSWLSVSSSSAGATTSPQVVTFTVSSAANSLPPGVYNGAVTFKNTTNDQGTQTRQVSLTVTTASSNTNIVSAVAPNARTTVVSKAVTAFATIANAGAASAQARSIALPGGVPGATLIYQTTNPMTNTPTGTPNTPSNVPAGQNQTFYFAITPTIVFSQEIPLAFNCANSNPAPVVPGLNTFLLTVG